MAASPTTVDPVTLAGPRMQPPATDASSVTDPFSVTDASSVTDPFSVTDASSVTERPDVAILVVDDNPTKRLALRAVLAPLGYRVVEADSGIAALRCLLVADFAVILLDVCMPVMSGFETAALIRQRQQSEMTPIIFITAYRIDEIAHSDLYAEGAVDFIFAPVPPNELRSKVSVFANIFIRAKELAVRALDVQTSADQLADQGRELQRVNHELTNIARRDPLTHLGNRRALTEDLEKLEARVRRYGHRYCLALLDIDHFKSYNDVHGHQAGDQILQTVAATLTEQMRSGDSLYRYGGEEFLCILPEQTIERGTHAVQRMLGCVEHLGIPHLGASLGVLTLSAGLAILDVELVRSPSEVLKEADEALYRAKNLGRNRVEA